MILQSIKKIRNFLQIKSGVLEKPFLEVVRVILISYCIETFQNNIRQQKKFLNKLEKHGGKVFLAHLYLYSLDNHIEYLEHLVKEKIIDGVEVYYSGFNLEQIEKLKTFCNTHNLLMSGGTDCHGTRKPIKLGIGLGNLNISEDVVKDWIWEMN